MVNDMPTAQFCFGSFPEQRNDDHIEPPKEYTNGYFISSIKILILII